MSITAYPLQWPEGYKRTHCKEKGRFGDSTVYLETSKVNYELKLLSAANIIISANIPLRKDGLPYSDFKRVEDAGVAIYFKLKENNVVLACDKYKRVEDNIHAIVLTIEAMRGMERWGVSDMLNRIFTGFVALPDVTRTWYEVLGVSKNATKDEIITAYRTLAKINHPDNGGSADAFSDLTNAYKEGLKQ